MAAGRAVTDSGARHVHPRGRDTLPSDTLPTRPRDTYRTLPTKRETKIVVEGGRTRDATQP